MRTTASWAFWRRVEYGVIFVFFFALIGSGIYFSYFYKAPSCFDGIQNGDERGIDCGGSCVRVCSLDTLPPEVLWSRAFKITDGQYNAVAYIENKNRSFGAPEVPYTFKLYDRDGLIVERNGVTTLPPNSVYPVFEGRIATGDRVPTQTIIEIADVDLWLPAESSRDQFVIEERQLIDVDSAPRLSASIHNRALTEARDVEIVATIFDSGGNALTVSRTEVPLFSGRETKNVIFTWPEPIAKTIRSCEIPTDVILGIDLSGSMNDDGGDPPEPITSVLRAADAFVKRLEPGDQAGVVTYASDVALAAQLSGNLESVGSTVNQLSIAPEEERGSTNTGDALYQAAEELTSTRHNANARKVLVLLSDGLANAPGETPEAYALEAASAAKEADIEIFTIGLGDRVNAEFLQKIATGDEYYFPAASADTVDDIYRSITEAICEDGPAVIDIIPKAETSFETLE